MLLQKKKYFSKFKFNFWVKTLSKHSTISTISFFIDIKKNNLYLKFNLQSKLFILHSKTFQTQRLAFI